MGVDLREKLERYSRQEGECRVWTGYLGNRGGYARVRVGGGRKVQAHRAAWQLQYGPVPDGLLVLHSCDNPACINIAHLFLGTHLLNMLDMVKKNRQAKGERSHLAKLTGLQVAEIRKSYVKDGITQRAIGERFRVSHRTISVIVRGETWRER